MDKLKIEYLDIDKLNHYANNCKIHTKEQIEHIANSIKEFGFNDPLGIAGKDNIVLEGNGRVEAAKLLGMTNLPCVRLDHMTSEEQQAYVIAHNSTNIETGFDSKVLLNELDRLQANFDFKDFGVKNEMFEMAERDDFYKDFLSLKKKKLVRNEFEMVGDYDLPLIKKQDIDIEKIELMNFNNTKYNDTRNKHKTIQFFTYDYKFDYVYSHPEFAVEKLKQYYCLLSPDYSLYTDMSLSLQIKNTFKNRWCGVYFQSLGLRVIPTIEWSDERSFKFCFDGVEKGSVVAVSTYGKQKIEEEFMKGYNKMLEIIKPSDIICYEKPFPKMGGKIKAFPYYHNEWRECYEI